MHLTGITQFLIGIALCPSGGAFFQNSEINLEDVNILQEAIAAITQAAFHDDYVYISLVAIEDEMIFRQKDILSGVLSLVDSVAWHLEQEGQLTTSDLRVNNIIFIDSYEAFRIQLQRLQNVNLYDATGYYLIVLLGKHKYSNTILRNILTDCWNLFIVNVNILMEPNQGIVNLHSYYPYTRFYCGEVLPVIVGSYFNGSISQKEIFPKKFFNLYGCPIRVITWNLPPFIILKNRTDNLTNDTVRIDGIEGNVLRNLAHMLNFSIKFLPGPAENPRGFIFENGTKTGTFGMLERGEGDLSLGCYRYSMERVKNFGTTHPYYQVPVVIALPIGESYTSLERLFYPFKMFLWLTLLSVFLIAGLLLIILRNVKNRRVENFVIGNNNQIPMYNMWISALGGQVNHTPRFNFARFILVLWFIVTLVIRSIYQGALYDFLRKDVAKEPAKTVSELVKAGFTVNVDPPTKELILLNKDLIAIHNISTEPQYDFLFRLQKGYEEAGCLLPQDMVIYFNNENHKNGEIPILEEQIFSMPVTIMFRKYSFLSAPISSLLWIYSGNGLLDKWIGDYTDPTYASNVQFPSPKQLTNEQFGGAYEVFAILISLACVVFIMEMLSLYCKKLKSFFDFLLK